MSCVLLVCNSPFEHVCWSCFQTRRSCSSVTCSGLFLVCFFGLFLGEGGRVRVGVVSFFFPPNLCERKSLISVLLIDPVQ